MRDPSAAPYNPPAPQAPARNPTPTNSLLTFNSHRRIRRKLGDKKVYRPVRRHTLSRIDEAPQPSLLTDFSSTRPILRSRSNISADTSRSVPVCNQSQEIGNQMESSSPQYAELGTETDSSYDIPASMTDLPVMIPLDPAPYYPQYAYYTDDGRIDGHKLKKKMKKLSSKHSNLYLAFMY